MKNLIYLIALLGIVSCQNFKKDNRDFVAFFEVMTDFKCIDSTTDQFALDFNYSYYNQENMAIEYRVPDSIPNADFYNAYAGRIVSAFYNKVNCDTTVKFGELSRIKERDYEVGKQKFITYCKKDETVMGIFDLAKNSFYNNEETKKVKVSIDSLVNISMSYFDIAAYSEKRGFAFHFGCGQNPFDFTFENRTNLLISDFCKEAIKNPKMSKAHFKITANISELIKSENEDLSNFQAIKKAYEPKLYALLKEEKVLKESLIFYYEKRKDIEPFILEY